MYQLSSHRRVIWFALAAFCFTLRADALHANELTNPAKIEKLKSETAMQVKAAVEPLLQKYCGASCDLVSIDAEVGETLSDMGDIGFEGINSPETEGVTTIEKVVASVQVDDRITIANRERMETIVKNALQGLGYKGEVKWLPVQLPQIGQAATIEESLKQGLERKLRDAATRTIDEYCPDQCVLSQLLIEGHLISLDEASQLSPTNYLRDDKTSVVVRIDNVTLELSVDEKMEPLERQKISSLLNARTRFAAPVTITLHPILFPETYAEKKAKKDENLKDPYGLEKLRETLKIFRELAGTKEIITNSMSSSESKDSATESLKSENMISSSSNEKSAATLSEKSEENSKESQNSTLTASATKESESNTKSNESSTSSWLTSQSTEQLVLYAIGLLGLLAILCIIAIRMARAKQDAKLMMAATPQAMAPQTVGQQEGQNGQGRGAQRSDRREGADALQNSSHVLSLKSGAELDKDLITKLRCDRIRDDVVQLFMAQPKIAVGTFKKILQEDGIEETAKYVHVLGKVGIHELFADPAMQRDLYALSEFYAKASFQFTIDQELEILQRLKMKCTATEIRVNSSHASDRFEFLGKLEPNQVYDLVIDEKPQVQSIVLTQLDQKKRLAVFDMYEGDRRVSLMQELSKSDAIPKEYLFNVATALSNKTRSRPEFDAEHVRSSDILIDLLERSDFQAQYQLMRSLAERNPETSRALKLKLVTTETLPFLKGGHLLEIILGMDRNDLLTFLIGTRDHIRNTLLSKAPPELAEAWLEDIQNFGMVDDQAYRLAELKVLNRVRNLAATGIVNLLQINEIMFQPRAQQFQGRPQAAAQTGFSRHANVA